MISVGPARQEAPTCGEGRGTVGREAAFPCLLFLFLGEAAARVALARVVADAALRTLPVGPGGPGSAASLALARYGCHASCWEGRGQIVREGGRLPRPMLIAAHDERVALALALPARGVGGGLRTLAFARRLPESSLTRGQSSWTLRTGNSTGMSLGRPASVRFSLAARWIPVRGVVWRRLRPRGAAVARRLVVRPRTAWRRARFVGVLARRAGRRPFWTRLVLVVRPRAVRDALLGMTACLAVKGHQRWGPGLNEGQRWCLRPPFRSNIPCPHET